MDLKEYKQNKKPPDKSPDMSPQRLDVASSSAKVPIVLSLTETAAALNFDFQINSKKHNHRNGLENIEKHRFLLQDFELRGFLLQDKNSNSDVRGMRNLTEDIKLDVKAGNLLLNSSSENARLCDLRIEDVTGHLVGKRTTVDLSERAKLFHKQYYDHTKPLNDFESANIKKCTVLWSMMCFKSNSTEWHPCVIDTGASRSGISRYVVNKLNLKIVEIDRNRFNKLLWHWWKS